MFKNNNRSGGSMPKPPAANEVPKTDEPSVKIDTGAAPAHSSVTAKEQKTGIMVKALRKGFIGGLRRNVDEMFLIPGKSSWGSWMECEDKELQKELVKNNATRIKGIREL